MEAAAAVATEEVVVVVAEETPVEVEEEEAEVAVAVAAVAAVEKACPQLLELLPMAMEDQMEASKAILPQSLMGINPKANNF